jgi:hypothetical protein
MPVADVYVGCLGMSGARFCGRVSCYWILDLSSTAFCVDLVDSLRIGAPTKDSSCFSPRVSRCCRFK